MNILPTIVSASDLQRDSARIINLAKNSNQPVVVMRNNKAEVAMLGVKELQRLMDKIQELELLQDIKKTEEDFKAGKLKVLSNDLHELLDD